MQDRTGDAPGIWDDVWSSQAVVSDYSLRYREFIESIIPMMPANPVVLEAGCGTGQTLRLFRNGIGIDISRPALDLAKENCRNVLQADIFSLPMKDGTCDVVYNSGVIEHFTEPINAVREMVRVLRPNGLLVIIVPNSHCLWYRIGKWLQGNRFEFGYEGDYSIERLTRMIFSLDLSIIKAFGLQALPPTATHTRELLPQYIRERIGKIDTVFPWKEYYAYAIGIIAVKP